jgi:Domain of unknown function (DUF4271)
LCHNQPKLKKRLFILFLLIANICLSQNNSDSVANAPKNAKKTALKYQKKTRATLAPKLDSVAIGSSDSTTANLLKKDTILAIDTLKDSTVYKILEQYPISNFTNKSYLIANYKNNDSKDYLFYLLVVLVGFLAIIKFAFPKYVISLFKLFFQTNFSQKKTKNQLVQNNAASVLLNAFFCIVMAVYITVLNNSLVFNETNFWQFFVTVLLVISSIYMFKYFFINIMGSLYQQKEFANNYLFLVFLINKILGIVLVPSVVLIAFIPASELAFVLPMSVGIICLFLIYRFYAIFTSFDNSLKLNAFHFFLYICSIEILPLLIIYKLALVYLSKQ